MNLFPSVSNLAKNSSNTLKNLCPFPKIDFISYKDNYANSYCSHKSLSNSQNISTSVSGSTSVIISPSSMGIVYKTKPLSALNSEIIILIPPAVFSIISTSGLEKS